MTVDDIPRLTPVQIIELNRFEALIGENLKRGKKHTVTPPDENGIAALVIDPVELEATEHETKTERHIQLHAELICYLAAEGIDYEHFHGIKKEAAAFLFSFSACSILRSRRDLFEEPESFGYAVLIRAGFRPPPGEIALAE